MGDILDQMEGDLDIYGDGGGVGGGEEEFTEQDVLGDDDEGPPGTESGAGINNGLGGGDNDKSEHNGDDQSLKRELDEDADDDLYDEAIEPSSGAGDVMHRTRSSIASTDELNNSHHAGGTSGGTANTSATSFVDKNAPGRRFFCYIGNMTWWTTDADLQNAIASCGVGDLVDLKFYENRANGQSKGFALAVFAAESAVRTVMEKLPTKQLHGQQMVVLPYTKSSLAKFEEATRRAERPEKKAESGVGGKRLDEKSGFVNMGTIRIGAPPPQQQQQQQPIVAQALPQMQMRPLGTMVAGGGLQPQQLINAVRPPVAANLGGVVSQLILGAGLQQQQQTHMPMPGLGRPPMLNMNAPPPGLPPSMSRPPPTLFPPGGLSTQLQQPMNVGRMPQMAMPPGGFPPPGAHINPQVYPGLVPQGRGMEGMVLSEQEFEEIMNRNRTVSSSAISRAVSDAATGDFQSAIETLVTAISLIRQSRVANDERCKVLIASLQDTLHGIETKGYGSSRKHRGGGGSGRDRSRSPERNRKRHRRASRSRSRSRERYEYSPRHSSSGRRY